MNQREQDRKRTRQHFIETAFRLFTAQGYGETSMNQIARQAGGSRANLYLHFRNKPDLVLARMREMEPEIIVPFRELFDAAPHTAASVRAWLEHMRGVWLDRKVEFNAVEQAMAQDETVASEWLGMMRRMSGSIPALTADRQRRLEFISLVMGLDRNFYFLYVRGHRSNEELVLRALSVQWLTLFAARE